MRSSLCSSVLGLLAMMLIRGGKVHPNVTHSITCAVVAWVMASWQAESFKPR
jgi:hypothetical protein